MVSEIRYAQMWLDKLMRLARCGGNCLLDGSNVARSRKSYSSKCYVLMTELVKIQARKSLVEVEVAPLYTVVGGGLAGNSVAVELEVLWF